MRFASIISACALVGSAMGSNLATRTKNHNQSPRNKGLVQRQALADLTLCATIAATVPITLNLPVTTVPILGTEIGGPSVLNLDQDTCLCVAGGVLTDESVARIGIDLFSETGLFADLLRVLGFGTVLDAAVDAVVLLLGEQQATNQCVYPANAIPQCDSCAFTCDDGFVRCGDLCVAGTVCPSSLVQRRNQRSLNPDLMCPSHLTACAVPGQVAGLFGKVDCVDTKNSVETCGGCEFPLRGRSKGVDCSGIAGAEAVSCQNGSCIVKACASGFVLQGVNTCVEVQA